jgi:hypothetical protein
VSEARKKREQILNEMAQYNDAPAATNAANKSTMRPGKLAETTNNKYFANRATKRTADVLGYNTTPPQNVSAPGAVPESAKKEEKPVDETKQKISLFAAFFAVFTFPFTLLYELFRACVDVLKKLSNNDIVRSNRDAKAS